MFIFPFKLRLFFFFSLSILLTTIRSSYCMFWLKDAHSHYQVFMWLNTPSVRGRSSFSQQEENSDRLMWERGWKVLGRLMFNAYVFDCSEDGLKSHLLISSARVSPYLCVTPHEGARQWWEDGGGGGEAVNMELWSGMLLVSEHAASSSYVRPLKEDGMLTTTSCRTILPLFSLPLWDCASVAEAVLFGSASLKSLWKSTSCLFTAE